MSVSSRVFGGIYTGVTTEELDKLAAEVAASMTTKHPDYALLAARIAVSNLHKKTKRVSLFTSTYTYALDTHILLCKVFSDVISDMHSYIHPVNGRKMPMVSDEIFNLVVGTPENMNVRSAIGPAHNEFFLLILETQLGHRLPTQF